jgi:hypothetical protein
MTLFTRALNIDLVSRVWDFYFLDGIFILYQTAIGIFLSLILFLAILRILEKHLLEEDFEGIMRIMKNIPEQITDEE